MPSFSGWAVERREDRVSVLRTRIFVVAFAGLAVGFALFVWLTDDSGSESSNPASPEGGSPTAQADEGSVRADRRRERTDEHIRRLVRRGLARGVREGASVGDGSIQAAVMLDGWDAPMAAATEPGEAAAPMRMWSIAKVVTAVSLLRELGWESDRTRREPSPQAMAAMRDALVRSENCRQRRMVLELQSLAGGAGGAGQALGETLDKAGAEADLDVDVEPPEVLCHEYLETQRDSVADSFAPTLLLGTATWQIGDMARFAHALGSGAYGEEIRERLFTLMRAPKGRSREVPSEDFSADLAWGAGKALGSFAPAYKSGWGGTLQGDFMAAQAVAIELDDGGTIAFAVAYHPSVQPAKDDPGLTGGPVAIERVLAVLAEELFES